MIVGSVANLGLLPLRKREPRIAKPLNQKRASLLRLRADLTRKMAAFLRDEAPKIAAQIATLRAKFGKADLGQDELDAIEAIIAGVNFNGWTVLVTDIDGMLAEIVRDGTVATFGQIGIGVEARKEVVNVVNEYALAYGRQRAAEMVGMRVDALGGLIPNPRAVWQITESTRDFLRADITAAIAEGWSNDRLSKALAESYGFSKERATVIARTETNKASNAGALAGYKASHVVGGKEWLTAEDDKVSPECELNGNAGVIALDANFPSGDPAPPVHPNAVFAGTLFAPYGELQEMVGADYHGPAILIRTAEDKLLPIGPNHPVLTQAGMVRADELRKGDYLVYDARMDDAAAAVSAQPDFDQMPFVENAFQTLLTAGCLTRVATARHNFHGDRVYCEGEIQVVEPTHRLLPILDACGIEKMRERKFMRPNVETVPPSRQGAGLLDREPIDHSTPLCMRGLLPAAHYRFLCIQSIHSAEWSGKAFDASTTTGVYNSHGFVVSNCRCTIAPVVDWALVDNLPPDLTE